MKILHVIPSFAPAWRYGGPIFAALGLTRELVRQGHDITVMTTNIDGPGVLNVPLDRYVFLGGVKVWYFPIARPKWYYFSPRLASALRNQVRDVDLVHIHSVFLWPTTIAAFWCRRYGRPYIVRPAGLLDPVCLTKSYETWQVSLTSQMKKWLYLKTLGKMDLERAAAIHFTSEAEMEAARPLRLRPPGFVVPLGVELERIGNGQSTLQLRERYPQLDGKKIILFLSRLDPKKGLNLLIAALAELGAERRDFAFVVAGNGTSEYVAELAALVKSHRLQDRTLFLGFLQGESKWALLQEADLFVLPSYHENFGVSVVEAMAAGLPVIISDRVNIHPKVRRAGAGLVVRLNANEIANAIDRLLTDGNLRWEMGNRGKLLVRESFSWEKVVKEVVQMYDAVLCTAHLRRRANADSADLRRET